MPPATKLDKFSEKYVRDKLAPHSHILSLKDSSRFQTHKYSILHELYYRKPISFIRDVLNIDLWHKQQEIAIKLDNLQGDNPSQRVNVVASHSVGKSYLAAALALYYTYTRKDAMVLTTAPTNRQVTQAIWRTMRDMSPFDDFVGTTATEIRISDTWKAIGFTASSADSVSGLHPSPQSQGGLIIVDEASGVDVGIWESLEGIYGEDISFLAIGNPLRTSCYWYELYTGGTFYNMHISALEHPNLALELAGKPPMFKNAIRLATVQRILQQWGKRVTEYDKRFPYIFEFPVNSGILWNPNNLFISRFLGRWPETGDSSLFDTMAAADIGRRVGEHDPERSQIILGVDVARFGDDFSVIIGKSGDAVLFHDRRNGFGTVELSGLIVHYLGKIETEYGVNKYDVPVVIDDTGIGGAVVDILGDWGYNTVPINFQQKATDPDKYANARSEMIFALAEKVNSNVLGTATLNTMSTGMLSKQMIGIQYTYDEKGRYIIESKKLFKKRTKISPDDLDALALAYYYDIYTKDIDVLDDDTVRLLTGELDRYDQGRTFFSRGW
jgi:hypothetical protein